MVVNSISLFPKVVEQKFKTLYWLELEILVPDSLLARILVEALKIMIKFPRQAVLTLAREPLAGLPEECPLTASQSS